MRTVLRMLTVPNKTVVIPMMSFNFLLSNLLTMYAATGVERATPMANGIAIPRSTVLPAMRYVNVAAIQVTPSATDVMAMADRALTPVSIWPAVTMGPYPPPLNPLLKAAMEPRNSSLINEKSRVFSRVASIMIPTTATKVPMYKLSAYLDSFSANRTYGADEAQACERSADSEVFTSD